MEQKLLIAKIAKRAAGLLNWDAFIIMLDLSACIEGGCELRLEDMLDARPFDLTHDIVGINRNLNHETRKLDNCFWPRFAK